MNEYENILNIKTGPFGSYNTPLKDAQEEACPICGGISWDYLLKDKDGDFVGCDDCLKKIYS